MVTGPGVNASCGTLPAAGDTIRIDPRATPDLPPRAWLEVVGTRSCTIHAWAYVDVFVLDDTGERGRESSVLVPVASITLYPDGKP